MLSRTIGVLSLIALFGLLGMGVLQALRSFENDVASWLPEREADHVFQSHFGAEAFLVASWDGCSLADERLPRIREAIATLRVSEVLDAPDRGELNAQAFDQVTDSQSLFDQFCSKPINVRPDQAQTRLTGWMLGKDGTACIVLRVTDLGWQHRHSVLPEVCRRAEACGVPNEALRLGGPMRNSVEVDTMGLKRVAPLAGISFLVTLALTAAAIRRLDLILPVLIYATASWMASLGLLVAFGGRLDSILIALPALVYVLSTSAAIHMTGYYQSIEEQDPSIRVDRALFLALKKGAVPCTIATITTLVGLLSLMLSELKPVSGFGLYASIGLAASWLGLFTLWPACVKICSPNRRRSLESSSEDAASVAWWNPVFRIATQFSGSVALIALLSAPLLLFGLTRMRATVGVADMFARHTDAFQDYQWFEDHLGGLIPLETIVTFSITNDESTEDLLTRIQLISRLSEFINSMPEVTGTVSPTTFLPPVSVRSGTAGTIQRRVLAAKVRSVKTELSKKNLIFLSPNGSMANGRDTRLESWRISCRIPGIDPSISHGEFVSQFESKVNEFLQESQISTQAPHRALIAGGGFQVARAQRQLLIDMAKSLGVAFLLIAIAMVLVCRNLLLGLLAMLPNLFPTILVFGCVGLLGSPIDAGAMITATIALGIAVDDTSHFLWWFTQSRGEGNSLKAAIYSAFRHCGSAMLRTTLICGIGLGVFFWSPFLPIAQFGAFLSGLLAAALIGDLLLFPALLKLFGERIKVPKSVGTTRFAPGPILAWITKAAKN